MEYKLARDEHARVLNPYQNAYLLLDNGHEEPQQCVETFRTRLDNYLSGIKTLGSGTYNIGTTPCPAKKWTPI